MYLTMEYVQLNVGDIVVEKNSYRLMRYIFIEDSTLSMDDRLDCIFKEAQTNVVEHRYIEELSTPLFVTSTVRGVVRATSDVLVFNAINSNGEHVTVSWTVRKHPSCT